MKARKLVCMALLAAIALTLFVVELQLPPLTPFPAVKMGLANIITLFMLQLGGGWKPRDALAVLGVRIVLGALITGQLMTVLFSGMGGSVAFLLMAASTKLFHGKLIPAVSVIGAAGHNIGQLTAACLFYGTASVVYYLPILLLSAIGGGLLTGFAVMLLFKTNPRFVAEIRRIQSDGKGKN